MRRSHYPLQTRLPLLIALSFCMVQSAFSAVQQPSETWLNVFVHGIMSVKPHIGVSNFLRFMTDNVDNTVYSETVRLMRNDPIFYQNQAMQELGLHEMDPSRIEPGNASGAMALAFERISQLANPDKQIKNLYYTFGWSGLMSVSRRYRDAIGLYKTVAQKVADLKAQGINPKVRIIGYSHGGNVLLNLGLVRQQEPNLLPLSIDELFLLGMPVQSETDYLINDPIFIKIYHIYSRGDRIQKLDFFSFKRFFSRRLFKPRKGFKLPEKLLQIQLKCTRNSVGLSCHPEQEAKLYNFNNRSIISGRSRFLRDASPGHTELWFFGWTPLHYRDNFPLKPFSAAALTPLIARYAHDFQERSRFEKPTLIDIRPEQEVVLVHSQKSKRTVILGKFLPKKKLVKLQHEIMRYAPYEYTAELYNGAIKKSLLEAQQWHAEKRAQERQIQIGDRYNRRMRAKERKCKHKQFA